MDGSQMTIHGNLIILTSIQLYLDVVDFFNLFFQIYKNNSKDWCSTPSQVIVKL